MAYFANGSEGERLEAQCNHCAHLASCPVYMLQFLWNYTQLKNETQKLALDTLVPDKDGVLCALFMDADPEEEDDGLEGRITQFKKGLSPFAKEH